MTATRFTLLGDLVDRAVSMPFAKPWRLVAGRRADPHGVVYNDDAPILDDIKDAASILYDAFSRDLADLGDPDSKAPS